MVLSYTTPKRARSTATLEFQLDGDTFIARRPKDSVMVFLMAANAESSSDADKVYAVMQFISGCLTMEDQARLQARLRDWDDDLEIYDLLPVMEDLAKEFGQDKPAAPVAGAAARTGRVITEDGEAVNITPAAPNRAARRAAASAAPKPAKKAAPAKKTTAAATRGGRALPR